LNFDVEADPVRRQEDEVRAARRGRQIRRDLLPIRPQVEPYRREDTVQSSGDNAP
jgi:hypothetical protein